MRRKCEGCGAYLIALKGKWLHPDSPCSGITDALFLSMEVEDVGLQEIWEKKYGIPRHDDYELLNLIWSKKWLRGLISFFIK